MMNRFFTLLGPLALALFSGCTSSASTQTAQAPPSVSTPVPVALVTMAPAPTAVAQTTVASTPLPSVTATAGNVSVGAPSGATSSAPSSPGVMGAAGSLPTYVNDFAAKIRASANEAEVNEHLFVLQGVESGWASGVNQDPAKAQMYAHGQTAMKHLQAAATFKAASFNAWNSTDAKSKILNMESELTAAQSEADTAQKMAEGKI